MTPTATPQRPAMPDATDLKQLLERGERSAADLLRQHLARLDATQGALNGATQVLREEAAEALRQARPGPLAGLPCSVKETFGIAGHSITAGSRRMTPQPQAVDAAVVAKLRGAGAIVMARSNVPEFAMTGETSNPRYGRSNNPLDPSRVAGGSTGGEGVLVGSGASAFGLGSDILGSIRIPAAFCGLVGFKPSSAAVDGAGTWPQIDGHSAGWLGIGPITRSVRDARMVYQVIAERAPAPPAPLAGLRLLGPAGFPYKSESPCIDAALAAAQDALGRAGMRPEAASFGDVGKLYFRMPSLILHDAAPSWQALLSTPQAGRFNVWGEALRQLTGRASIDPGLFMWMLQGATLGQFIKPRGTAQLARLVATFEAARAHYRGLLGADGILLLPTLGLLAPKHGGMNRKTLRPGPNGLMTPITFCNYCDLPAIAVPAWRHADPATGLAPSVMLACAPGAEGHLFDAAVAVEAALN